MYKVYFQSEKIKKSLRSCSKEEQNRICKTIIKKLQNYQPIGRGIKKLKGFPDLYRMRIGDYRVLFDRNVKEKTILVVLIEKRDSVYNDKS